MYGSDVGFVFRRHWRRKAQSRLAARMVVVEISEPEHLLQQGKGPCRKNETVSVMVEVTHVSMRAESKADRLNMASVKVAGGNA